LNNRYEKNWDKKISRIEARFAMQKKFMSSDPVRFYDFLQTEKIITVYVQEISPLFDQ